MMVSKRKISFSKKNLRPMMRVQCGSLDWAGRADSADAAIITALVHLPDSPSLLLRVHDGWRWLYLDFGAALKIAGYSVRESENKIEIL